MKTNKSKSNTLKNRSKAMKAQKQANKYAYRLETKKLRHEKFIQKQKTKRLSQLPESIKAAGQAIALASSPTAGSIASTRIANSPNEQQQMSQLINPTQVAGTNNEEEEKEISDKLKEYLPR